MSLRQMQKTVDDWAKQFKDPYWTPHAQLTRTMEELGEVARELHHLHGPKRKKAGEPDGDLGEELADTILTLVFIANANGVDLEKAWQETIAKIRARDNNRFEKV